MKKNIAKVLLLALTLSAVSPMQDAEAAKKLTLSEKSLSMKVGATKTVKANKAVKWKISGKKVVKLNKLSGKKVKITAKKVGTCKVTAIAGKKKASIRINVSKAKKNVKSTPTVTPQITVQPTNTPVITPEVTGVSSSPAVTINPAVTQGSTGTPEPTSIVENTVEPTAIAPTKEPITVTTEPTTEPIATTPVSTNPTSTMTVATEEPVATATVQPTVTPTATPVVVSASGIIMTLDSYENGKLTYTVKNQESHGDMMYTYAYRLEKEVNGEWISLERDRVVNIADVLMELELGSEKTETINLIEEFDLTEGSYRFTKTFIGTECKCMAELQLPFTVTNTIIYKSGISMTLDSIQNGTLSYTVENHTDSETDYSIYTYSILKEVNGEWVKITPNLYRPVPESVETLKERSKNSHTQNIKGLTPGNYIFQLSIKNESFRLPFQITKEEGSMEPIVVSNAAVEVVADKYENGALTYEIINKSGKTVKYYYIDVERELSDGDWAVVDLAVWKYENISGTVEGNKTVQNTEQLDLSKGKYRFLISFTVKGDEKTESESFTYGMPFEVK
ncbi:MAG: hypothetical protein II992_09230 [Lachnospiraceae bacterium]|nr:hypothetical protein [Lachnospiraceae bacterium]